MPSPPGPAGEPQRAPDADALPASFFVASGSGHVATELTRGPWDHGAQHFGPPAALLGRELERTESREGFEVARVTFEILGPLPIGEVEVSAEVVRPGRTVELLDGELHAGGRVAARARAWRIRRERVELDPEPEPVEPPPGPDGFEPRSYFLAAGEVGWHRGMEFRSVRGGFDEIGPGTVWMRMAAPLLEGEAPSSLQRVLAAADAGNGISGPLRFDRFIFVNTDLTVSLHREPAGEWVCLDSTTRVEPNGVGLTTTALYDTEGPIGLASQTLVVRSREG